MNDIQLGIIESKFADIIWNNEPLTSSALAKMAEEIIGWKKTTSYTVLKRLCDKGLFENNGGTVSSVISKNEFYSKQSKKFVDETFNGSLPAFLAAFTAAKALTNEEIAELHKIIDNFEE